MQPPIYPNVIQFETREDRVAKQLVVEEDRRSARPRTTGSRSATRRNEARLRLLPEARWPDRSPSFADSGSQLYAVVPLVP
jgi:hypothetical protein